MIVTTSAGAQPARRHRAGFGFLLMALAANLATADESRVEPRFVVDLGSYFLNSTTDIRVDPPGGGDRGSSFHVEDVFDLQDETVFRLEGAWRFKPRHAMRLLYFDSSRTSAVTLDRDIDFGDETFPLNAEVTSKFDFTVMELAYRYTLLKRENFELDASAGVHNIRFRIDLGAELESGGSTGEFTTREEASANAPLPVVGLGASWRLGEEIYLLAHAQYFQVSIDGIDGNLQDLQAGLLWQFSPHMGIGAAYNQFELDVDAKKRNFRGMLDWNYRGPQVFLRAAF